MKKTQLIELIKNIKSTFVSFFSILMFVALGVAVFVGMSWTSTGLKQAIHQEAEIGNFYDIKILFPYGFSTEDLEKLSQVSGVDKVEGSVFVYEQLKQGEDEYQIKVMQLNDDLDVFTALEGTLPQKEGEIAVDADWAKSHNIKIGDTITFQSDYEGNAGKLAKLASYDTEKDDPESLIEESVGKMEYLTTDTFTVTALMQNSEYMVRGSFTYGVSETNSTQIDALMYVAEDSINSDSFAGYTQVFVQSSELRNYFTYSDTYKERMNEISEELEKTAKELVDAKNDQILSNADSISKQLDDKLQEGKKEISDGEEKITSGESQISDAKQKIEDGESQIADGKEQIRSGEEQLSDGKSQLSSGESQLASAKQQLTDGESQLAQAAQTIAAGQEQISNAQAQIEAGQSQIDEGWVQLNEGKAQLAQKEEEYNAGKATLQENQEKYDRTSASYQADKEILQYVNEQYQSGEMSEEECILYLLNSGLIEDLENFAEENPQEAESLSPYVDSILQSLQEGDYDAAADQADSCMATLESYMADMKSQLDSGWEQLSLAEEALTQARNQIASSEAELNAGQEQINSAKAALEEKTAELNSGIVAYNEKKAQLEAGKTELAQKETQLQEAKNTISEKEKELTEAKATLADKEKELEEGKVTLSEKEKELAEAKVKLADGKSEYEKGVQEKAEYDESVSNLEPSQYLIQNRFSIAGVTMGNWISNILSKARYAMAGLFLIVGLLVCYSAIMRIVNDQSVRLGTKKSLGLYQREIVLSYLLYTGIAVVIGCVIGLLVGVTIVEEIILAALRSTFTTSALKPVFLLPQALLICGLELGLLLLITYLAARGVLKKNAVKLLAGQEPPKAKKRFYENFAIWKKLPLFTQTIINNCVNDKRRVFGTVIGIAGCTALIVTALTLNDNVLDSFQVQFNKFYHFDTVINFDAETEGTQEKIEEVLEEMNCQNTVVSRELAFLKQPGEDKSYTYTYVTVPKNLEEFQQIVNLCAKSGDSDTSKGVWMNYSYLNEYGNSAYDGIEISSLNGESYQLFVNGFYEYYLPIYNQLYMDQESYESIFEKEPTYNAILVNTQNADKGALQERLSEIEGYRGSSDFYASSKIAFNTFKSASSAMVMIYMILSVLMAFIVLLNLLTMFVNEKKRELIVLMINGFSLKYARRYIYSDTILLAVIGIILGIVLGNVIGAMSVSSFNSAISIFLDKIDWRACLIGAAGSVVLTFAMSCIALRRIGKFKLTDINK